MPRRREVLKDFGDALAAALAGKSWTQSDLGEALGGVTQSAISAWRSGAAEPAPATVFAIEHALELPPGTLSRHLGYLPAGNPDAVAVAEAVERDPYLSASEKRALMALYAELRRGRDPGSVSPDPPRPRS